MPGLQGKVAALGEQARNIVGIVARYTAEENPAFGQHGQHRLQRAMIFAENKAGRAILVEHAMIKSVVEIDGQGLDGRTKQSRNNPGTQKTRAFNSSAVGQGGAGETGAAGIEKFFTEPDAALVQTGNRQSRNRLRPG